MEKAPHAVWDAAASARSPVLEVGAASSIQLSLACSALHAALSLSVPGIAAGAETPIDRRTSGLDERDGGGRTPLLFIAAIVSLVVIVV